MLWLWLLALGLAGESEVVLKSQVSPEYPWEAMQAGHEQTRCLAIVKIGEDGVPYEVVVQHCPEAFHRETDGAGRVSSPASSRNSDATSRRTSPEVLDHF